MVVAIGIGTELAIDGAIAHAFNHVLYKSLLFMCLGAVIFRTGEIRATHLGGLFKKMPWTTGFCFGALLFLFLFSVVSSVNPLLLQKRPGMAYFHLDCFIFCFCGCFSSSRNKNSILYIFCQRQDWPSEEAPLNMLIGDGIGLFSLSVYGM